MLMYFIDMSFTTTSGNGDIALGVNVDGPLFAMNGGCFKINVMAGGDRYIALGMELSTNVGALAIAPLIISIPDDVVGRVF